jgi:hypothetical protein
MKRPALRALDRDYEAEIETALRALWQGWLQSPTRKKR